MGYTQQNETLVRNRDGIGRRIKKRMRHELRKRSIVLYIGQVMNKLTVSTNQMFRSVWSETFDWSTALSRSSHEY